MKRAQSRQLLLIPGSSVAYRSSYTLSLTNIPVYTPGDRPLYPRLQTNILGNSVADKYIRILCRWPVFRYVLQVTGGYTRVQCSLEILLYFVTDRYSGSGERQLYLKLQTDTLGYSVADRFLYTLSPTDIPVYFLGDRPLYPGLLTDTPVYSVAYRSCFTVTDQYSGIPSMWQTTIPRVTDWYTG